MNTLLPEIVNRKSTRRYKSDPISDEDILLLMEAARLAPSSRNTQPWRFIVIRDEEKRKRIAAADHNQTWMLTAPVMIACLADLHSRGETFEGELLEDNPLMNVKRIILDSGIAITHIMLQAERMGLGTCWTGWYDHHEMRQALGVDDNMWITGILTLGVPDEVPKARPRLSLEEIVRFE